MGQETANRHLERPSPPYAIRVYPEDDSNIKGPHNGTMS